MKVIKILLSTILFIVALHAQGQSSSLNVGINYMTRLQSAKANIRMPEYIGEA